MPDEIAYGFLKHLWPSDLNALRPVSRMFRVLADDEAPRARRDETLEFTKMVASTIRGRPVPLKSEREKDGAAAWKRKLAKRMALSRRKGGKRH